MACVLGAFVVLAGWRSPALAHAEFESSDPPAGSVLDTAPTSVTLTFSEPIEIGLGAVRLFDGFGRPVEVGVAEHPAGADNEVRIGLPSLADGSYVVDWKVVSDDGHPVRGAYTFQVGPESTLQAGILAGIIGSDSTGRSAGVGLAIARAVVIAATAVVFGGLVILGLGVIGFSRRVRIVLFAGSAAGFTAGLLQLPLEVGYATGRSVFVVFDPGAWGSGFDSEIGTSWAVRAALIGIVGVGLTLTGALRSRTWWIVTALIGAIGVGVASAYGGHGASGRWPLVGIVATAIHVVAMSVWLGGLTLLLVDFTNAGAAGIRRFSNLAAATVALIVLSGVIQSIRQLGSLDALTGTTYGTLLIWKVLLVAAMIAVAALSRRAVRPGVDVVDVVDRPRLRRALAVEVMIAVAIVVVTSMLMASNPSAATGGESFSATLIDGEYLLSITVEPATVGRNEVHIYLSNATSSLVQPDDVTVTISDPSRDVAPIDIEVVRSGAGHYTALDATFPYAASWTLIVSARYNQFDEVTFITVVPIT